MAVPTVKQAQKIIDECENSITIPVSIPGRESTFTATKDEIGPGGLIPTSHRSDRVWDGDDFKNLIAGLDMIKNENGIKCYQLADGELYINDHTDSEWKCWTK